MSYTDKVLSKVLTPGFAMIVIGAVIALTSGAAAAHLLPEEKQQTGALIIKAAGTVFALIGAVLLFTR